MNQMTHLEYVKRKFDKAANKQEIKGIRKYGQPLDPIEDTDWLKMAEEEQVDGYKYLVAEMEKRKFIVGKIRKLMEYLKVGAEGTDEEINYWLDHLEGKNHERN